MAPLPVIWPSPLKSVNRPLTLIRPHMFLILKRPSTDRERVSTLPRCRDHSAVSPQWSLAPPLPTSSKGGRPRLGRSIIDAADQVIDTQLITIAHPQGDR